MKKLTPTEPDPQSYVPPAYIVKAKAQKLPKSDLSLSGGSSGKNFIFKK